jgi:hypothetical protein
MVEGSPGENEKAGLFRRPLFLVGLALLLTYACTEPPLEAPKTPVIKATLKDEVRDLPGGQIEWWTWWEACWDKDPKAIAYEIQTMTSEGTSRKLRRQQENCIRMDVARGRNPKSAGLLDRELMLGNTRSMLGYRVRTVREDGPGDWSERVTAGDAR